MGAVLLVVLILLLFGSFPAYPYSRSWGYYPSGGLGLILLILLVLILMNQITFWDYGPAPVVRPLP
jgi:hypothetical protein